MFSQYRLRRRLAQLGSSIETRYLLYLNNESPIEFDRKDNLIKYVKNFRSENQIFNLQIFRIETYSL